MFPKEHGAYGQLAFPLATSLAIAGVTLPALLIVVAGVAGFLTHEPLLVLVGHRGPRARREQARRAAAWLTGTCAIAIATGSLALWLASAEARWSFVAPIVPTGLLIGALMTGREKSTLGEVAAAIAFSFLAIPVCVTAGASVPTAFAVGIAFACLFVVTTLGVRIVILKVRGGGDPRRVKATRVLLVVLAGGIPTALTLAAVRALLPWGALLSVVPGALVALALAARPPAPARLRMIGWTLVSISALTAAILVVTLTGAS